MPNKAELRVGYILKRYPRYSETFVVNEIIAHEKAGLEIDIFSLRYPEDQHFQDIISRVQAPVRYVQADEGKSNSFWNLLKKGQGCLPYFWSSLQSAISSEGRDVYQAMVIAMEVKEKSIQHLHAHFASKAATIARLASGMAGISYSVTAHAKDIFHEDISFDEVQSNLAEAAYVITVSDFNVKYLREVYGIDGDKVRRIYNGLDLTRFPYRTPKDRPPAIIAVGRLVEKKGFSDLVEACNLLSQRRIDYECLIIGAGPLESELQRQIEGACLQERVTLLGPRPQNEVIQRIQGSAAMAAPCIIAGDRDKDGLPTVLVEAMALGTPCVSTDVTGIPEIVVEGKTGLVVPQRDPSHLADALEALLTQPGLRTRLSDRARKLIEEEFDIDRNTEQVRAVFREAWRAGARILQEVH
ncbi:MAG: glycosyltransferase family 4 protein [Dehalococcoidia bacterium]|nr:glycosyltransferase family 4 protein [Dehalococcoidia bacterium]